MHVGAALAYRFPTTVHDMLTTQRLVQVASITRLSFEHACNIGSGLHSRILKLHNRPCVPVAHQWHLHTPRRAHGC